VITHLKKKPDASIAFDLKGGKYGIGAKKNMENDFAQRVKTEENK